MHEVRSWAAAQAPAHDAAESNEALETMLAATTSYKGTFANMALAADSSGDMNEAEDNHAAYFDAYNSDPTSSDAVQKLYQAPATAMTRISDMARISAGWNPVLLGGSAANAQAYQTFLTKVVSMPLLTLKYASTETMTKESSSWSEMINQIADLFVGIQSDNKTAIVSGLTNIANAASSTAGTSETTSVFVQNAMNVGNNAYSLYLYNTSFSFVETKGKGFDTKTTKMRIVKVKLDWQTALWSPENAQVLVGNTSKSIKDWGDDNGAPKKKNTIPALGGS